MEDSSLYVGIDISKFKHDIAIMTYEKKLLKKPFIIKEDKDGYRHLAATIGQLKQKHQAQRIMIGMEATGDYWKNLYHFLKNYSADYHVLVINPVRTKAYAKTELRRAKTDIVNAKDIACFMIEKKPESFVGRSDIFETIKDIDGQIYALNKQKTMTMNRMRIELGKVAPEIERRVSYLDGAQILALLNEFPTAAQIRDASLDQLRAITYGKKNRLLTEKFIQTIKKCSLESIAFKKGPGAGYVVQSLVRNLLKLKDEIQMLKNQLTELYLQINENESLLTSISGISKETAIILESYIGDVRRFPNSKTIVAYFGMNPVVNQSGKSNNRASYLEKKGSGIVRHKLYMIILNIIRLKTEPIYSYYNRLVASGKAKLVAIGAAMRKLLVIIYTLLKKQKKFDPNYEIKNKKKI